MILNQLTSTIKGNKKFMVAYSLLLIVGLYPLLGWDKMQLFLVINEYHHPVLDRFFYYWTHLGSGISYMLLLVVLFFLKISYRKLVIGFTSFAVMSIVIQVLKRVLFPYRFRPIKILKLVNEVVPLHIVHNVDILTDFSFPSGHAATIFTAVCFLNLIMACKYSWYSLGLLFVAMLVAYSRVYLCQHFYTDVYVGAWIGGWITLIVYVVLIDFRMPSWLASRLPFKL